MRTELEQLRDFKAVTRKKHIMNEFNFDLYNAWQKGYNSAYCDEMHHNPYDEKTEFEQHVEWKNGWRESRLEKTRKICAKD